MSDYQNLGVQYGAKVVGEEEAARQARVREITSGQTYGSLVIGSEHAAELKALTQPVPRAEIPTETPPQPGTEAGGSAIEPPPSEAEKAKPTYTLAQLSAILADQPHMLDQLIEAEIVRPEGPRKGAVEMFLISAREQGRTADFVEAIQALRED